MNHTSDTTTSTNSISDARLVDYILRVLPANEMQLLDNQLANDPVLQKRVPMWEAALFQLNDETAPIEPPRRVWTQIEKKCFAETSSVSAEKNAWWQRWGRFAVPALLSLCLLWVGSVTLSQRPTYAATVAMSESEPMWKIKGNEEYMTFVSVKNIHMKGMNCVVWLEREGAAPVLLGVVPDTGREATQSIELPEELHLQAGDRVTVGMIDAGEFDTPPTESMMPVSVILASI